ncbi:hypothetical protein PRIPAC_75521 [Pristionchus pacificus]|uniref:Uncharacterized protein n=1 Tax=Pristionchus pacificus TaxID=54126 RepID=A0A2A6CRC3_PRIPA|nr:hypothetical protein PRIPAC_75521 [Pristionchus pacificus]|eukprot:PDM80607.1 hypothetical protein PRIPAC_35610 [Pristionchus pacificus]
MRLLLPLLLLLPSLHSMTVMESYERHLNDLTPPVLQKTSPRGPMRIKRYKCIEEYVDLPVSSTSESLSLFSRPLPPLNPNQDRNRLSLNQDREMVSANIDGSFGTAKTASIARLMESGADSGLMEGENDRIDKLNEGDDQLQRVEADHGGPISDEMMFFSDAAPPATRPTPPRQQEPAAAAAPTRNFFSPPLDKESAPPSPSFSPQFVPPSFSISSEQIDTVSSPFIQLPPPNTIASSRPISQIRVPASTGRALPAARPVQQLQQLQKLHSGGRSVNGDRELPDFDMSMDEGSRPTAPSGPPLFSAAAAAPASPAASPLIHHQSPPPSALFAISPTPLPPLPDFGAAPTFSLISRHASRTPDLLASPHQSGDVEDISVVPLNPSNPARGPKAIMRNAGAKKHLPLNSNEAEDIEPPHEFVSYGAKTFRSFNRNSTRPSFKSAEPTEKLWAFSSWKAEEV